MYINETNFRNGTVITILIKNTYTRQKVYTGIYLGI